MMITDLLIAAVAASVIVALFKRWRERRATEKLLRRLNNQQSWMDEGDPRRREEPMHGACGCRGDQHCNACFDAAGR